MLFDFFAFVACVSFRFCLLLFVSCFLCLYCLRDLLVFSTMCLMLVRLSFAILV